ncbi:transposase family protein [Lysinibacillus sp. 54212]|uniref:transposase family protein n=1 Tax=Lysinibacillus sp. 54212 TaxID=3119829 RepID=UPI003FA612F3
MSLPKKEHTCPSCRQKISNIHDYRIQKIKHLKWFEYLTILFNKRPLIHAHNW